MSYLRPAWAEIDLDALAFNLSQIRSYTGGGVKIMAVVKCDAYGTGIAGIIDTLEEQGVDMYGVGILDEGIVLRRSTAKPILVFGYTPFEYSELLVRHNIMQTIYCVEQAEALSAAARGQNKKAPVHIEIDTGMGRLGFLPSEVSLDAILKISTFANLELQGIYTHCPYTNEIGGEGASFTDAQFMEFCGFIRKLEERGVSIPLRHACNSLGAVNYRHMHLDMIRGGIILYGSYPHFQNTLPLKPVLSLKARVGSVKKLAADCNVSYGRTFTTARETLVATLPIGYGDGLNRLLTNRGEVLVRGRRAPIIGTICMDQTMIDVTGIEGCMVGEEVVLLGRQGDDEITVEEMALKICGFINYEYLTLIHRRVPRVYIKKGRTEKVINNFC